MMTAEWMKAAVIAVALVTGLSGTAQAAVLQFDLQAPSVT